MQSGELTERAREEEGDGTRARTPEPPLSHDLTPLHFLFMMDMSINQLLDDSEGVKFYMEMQAGSPSTNCLIPHENNINTEKNYINHL